MVLSFTGIIGTSSSSSTEKVATFSDTFGIPVVSYMATAPELTFSRKFPNFLRTIPPDNELMEVCFVRMCTEQYNFIISMGKFIWQQTGTEQNIKH